MDLLNKICSHKSQNGQFYMVDCLTQVRRKHEKKSNNTGVKLDRSLNFSASFNKTDSEDSSTLLNNLERKITELDKLITEKVGFSFVKRGEKERKRNARKRVSGYFANQVD